LASATAAPRQAAKDGRPRSAQRNEMLYQAIRTTAPAGYPGIPMPQPDGWFADQPALLTISSITDRTVVVETFAGSESVWL